MIVQAVQADGVVERLVRGWAEGSHADAASVTSLLPTSELRGQAAAAQGMQPCALSHVCLGLGTRQLANLLYPSQTPSSSPPGAPLQPSTTTPLLKGARGMG